MTLNKKKTFAPYSCIPFITTTRKLENQNIHSIRNNTDNKDCDCYEYVICQLSPHSLISHLNLARQHI